MRIGQGIDYHRFSENRKVILGGVDIPCQVGLQGHSDADVLLHSLCDAILGAAGLGDIGLHFPDSDDTYKGISSEVLLEEVLRIIHEKFFLVNVDITLMGEKPKIAPHRIEIRDRLATLLKLDQDRVNIKATTTEKMGALGREEGLACLSVVLLEEKDGTL